MKLNDNTLNALNSYHLVSNYGGMVLLFAFVISMLFNNMAVTGALFTCFAYCLGMHRVCVLVLKQKEENEN